MYIYLLQVLVEAPVFAAATERVGGCCSCDHSFGSQHRRQTVGRWTCGLSDRWSLYCLCHETTAQRNLMPNRICYLALGYWKLLCSSQIENKQERSARLTFLNALGNSDLKHQSMLYKHTAAVKLK